MAKVFVAGATGYVGQALVPKLIAAGHEVVAHVRPGSPTAQGQKRTMHAPTGLAQVVSNGAANLFPAGTTVAVVDLADKPALLQAMTNVRVVVQLIGTTRAQFQYGMSYETVDYGTTVALLAAAKAAGTEHVVLLSSIGASEHGAAYLRWKFKTEMAVKTSGLAFTVLRPSFIAGPGRGGNRLLDLPLRLAAGLGAKHVAARYRSIDVAQLAQVIERCVSQPSKTQGRILEGTDLWALVS